MITLASLALANLCAATPMGELYENRCANCHGVKADGVPKISERQGVDTAEASASGIASQATLNIYGPPLKHLTKAAFLAKMAELRGNDMLSDTHNVDMMKNLKKIEAREGKVIDEEMADYIVTTFGSK
jgi:hypothetical protein